MSEHESYEILCAVAASGRASANELEQLSSHVRECQECRERVKDFAQLSAQVMPLYGDAYAKPRVPSNMTERFLERTRAEGISLHQPVRVLPRWDGMALLRWGAVAAVILVTAVGARHFLAGRAPASHVESTVAHVDSMPQLPASTAPNSASKDLQEVSQLRDQLSSAQNEIDKLTQQLATLREELVVANTDKSSVNARLASLESVNSNLSRDASAKDGQIADLNRQLKQKDSLTTEQLANVVEKQAELEKLSAELAERQNELEHERQLLVASAQARDLITARNLHIIDVHDNDRSGRQRPFGRIFYTEGQSLIFYAYDLNTAPDGNAKLAFHVWGGSLGTDKQAMSLGIFRSEDTAAGRWVLSFDDPRVLARINTVFVTAESAKNNSPQPKGKRILYAFLGEQPNHP
jgi:hypothetical protein